eukprot:12480_1
MNVQKHVWIGCVLAILQLHLVYGTDINGTLTINYDNVTVDIPTPYYGFDIDWWKPGGWNWGMNSILYINLSNSNLISLVSAVTPATLRIGGAPQDSIIYDITGDCNASINNPYPNQTHYNHSGYYCGQVHPSDYACLLQERWRQIFDFVNECELDFVFGLNACNGRKNYNKPMNMSNLNGLLKLTAETIKFNTSRIKGFEFGNEIAQYGSDSGINVNQYASDFIEMGNNIKQYWPNEYYKHIPWTMGTDDELNIQFVSQLLNILKPGQIDRVTYHDYANCLPGNYSVFDMNCLETIPSNAAKYANVIAKEMPNTPLWIGESAAHGSAGINGETNAFMSNFYYIYQLSEVLQNGVSQVLRSDLIGGNYCLINGTTFEPYPDYWILYLWKKWIGNAMLENKFSDVDQTDLKYIRAYTYRGKNEKVVIIVLINFSLYQTKINVTLELKGNLNDNGWTFEEYIMKGPLNSTISYMNGKPLIFNGSFPELIGKKTDGIVSLEPATIVWIVATNTN